MRMLRTCALGLVFCLAAAPAMAATGEIARVVAFAPQAEAEGSGGLRELALKAPLFEDDEVRTGEKGMVQLLFNDDTTMTLDAGSSVLLSDFGYGQGEEPSFAVDMGLGLMRMVTGAVVSQDPEAFSVKTPHATIGIRGTGFSVAVSPDNTLVTAFQLTGGHTIEVVNEYTGETLFLNSTDMAVRVGPDGSSLIPLPELPAADAQFIARPSLSGVQNGANPDDGLGGNDREDALLDFGQIAVPGMGQDADIPPVAPAYTSAEVTVPLSGYSESTESGQDYPAVKFWDGKLTFSADLASGAASNAAFSLKETSSTDYVSGTDGVFDQNTDLKNGTFSVQFTQLEGAFSDLDTSYDITGGYANINGTADLTDAETTGKGSGTMTGLDISLQNPQAQANMGIMPFLTAQVTGELNGSSTLGNDVADWTGTLNFEADLNSGLTRNASFVMDGVNRRDGMSMGRVEGVDGVAMLYQPSMTEFALSGFTLKGSAVAVNNQNSTADFRGSMKLDEATRTGTAEVQYMDVVFSRPNGDRISINNMDMGS